MSSAKAAVGVLEREKLGRRNSYQIRREARLRHPLEGHCTIGGLLDWVSKSAREQAKKRIEISKTDPF